MTEKELTAYLQKIAMERLMRSPAGEKLQQAIDAGTHIAALLDSDDPQATGIKAITVLTFALLKKISQGKTPLQLDKQDWKDIASVVSQYALLTDGQAYSVFIFGLYEKSIRACTAQLENIGTSGKTQAIAALADELALYTEQLKNGDITEVQYTENCLWTSMEAAVKLVAAFSTQFAGSEAAEFGQAVAAYAFEYGRLMLYKKEQAILTEFVEHQYQLDAELERKYKAYLSELETQSQEFLGLVAQAFAPDFREAFLQSVLLAKASGVKDEETLHSIAETDMYFLK